MATFGITVEEAATSLAVPIESSSGVQVAVGTAPINLTANPAAFVNTPVLTNNFPESVTKLGYTDNFKDHTLCQVMDISYRVFSVRPVIFINVLDPARHKEDVEAHEVPIIIGKAAIEVGDAAVQGILLATITVKSQDGGTTYVADVDYIAAFDDYGAVIISAIASGSIPTSATALLVNYSKLDPSAVTEADILGGYNAATGAYRGIECISRVYPLFNIVPNILLAPGWSHKPAVAMALLGKAEFLNGNLKCLAYIDIDSSTDGAPTYDTIKTWKDQNGYTDKWMYLLWPKAVIGEKVYYLSAVAAAVTAYSDTTNANIPAHSPSNNLLRITGAINEAGEEVALDSVQATYVNECGVGTAINIDGWRLWGNYTAAYPGSTDPKDFWLNFRRFFAWDANETVLTFSSKKDEPISTRLVQTIVNTKNIRANGLVAAGNLAAYRTVFDLADNPLTNILGGTIRLRLIFAPYPPAQEIIFTQEFDPNALYAEFGGGA